MDSYRISRQLTRKFKKRGIRTRKLNGSRRAGNQAFFRVTKNAYFLFSIYLKTYPAFDALGFHLGLSAGQIHDYFEPFLRVLERALTDLDQLPEVTLETPEDLSQLVDQYNDIIIDRVEMACVRLHDEAHQ